MKKIIELDDHFPTGEDTVQLVLPTRRGIVDVSRVTKTASEAVDYIKNVSPEPGKTHLLLLGLGAEETYGPNRNGDGFSEFPVPARGKEAASRDHRWFIEPGQELTKHYKSFETNPAHAFKHHQNKDKTKASGYVKKAFWNPKMHRVELLTVIDNEKDAEWIQRVEQGEYPAVSMGCFGAGTPITMADGTRKPIEAIQVNDLVMTHLGRARKVTEVHQRPYKGDLYTIRAEAHEPIRATAEHPFYATERTSVRRRHETKSYCQWRTDARVKGDWVHASCLQDHYLLEPVAQATEGYPYLTRAFARLLGYYVAEGHIIWRNNAPYGIELTTNVNDAVHAEIEELCDAFGTRNKPCTFQRTNCESALGIMICDDRLARMCLEHGAVKAKQKRLSLEVMQWPVEMQRELFGAYANGDGCSRDGWLKVSTASDDLAWQWMSLLPRLGILPSINRLVHKAGSGFSRVDTYEWVIHIGKQWTPRLRGTCAKVTPSEVLAKKESRRIVDQWVVTPSRDIDVMYVEMPVYNFEVEEDNSYVAGGLAVHNCRIKYDVCSRCGNQAPTRSEYCDHAKFAMSQLNPDGTKNFVYNPDPDFFDISRVFRPADHTAYTLKKVAEVHEVRSSAELGEVADFLALKAAAARKLSEMDKVIRGEPVATSTLSPDERSMIVKFKDHAGAKLASSPSLPPALLGHSLRTIVSATNRAGIVLKDAEFVDVVLGPTAPSIVEKIAEAASVALELFEESPALLSYVLDECKLGQETAPDALLDVALEAFQEKRAYAGEYLYRRLVPEGVGLRPDAAPTTDVLHTPYGDTTRGAAVDAMDATTRAHAAKVLGGTGLMLGGYKMLTAFPWLNKMRAPLAVGMGALGYKALSPRPGGTIPTAEGPEIPDITEMAPKTAAVVHLVECRGRPRPRRDLTRTKVGARIDSIEGLVLDPEVVADFLGSIVTE